MIVDIFTYCFTPQKLTLHGSLRRKNIEELLARQAEKGGWLSFGVCRQDPWSRLGALIELLLNATTLQPTFFSSENQGTSLHSCVALIEVDISALQRIDTFGWAGIVHLLYFLKTLREKVFLTGILPLHKRMLTLYNLETLLAPYLLSPMQQDHKDPCSFRDQEQGANIF